MSKIFGIGQFMQSNLYCKYSGLSKSATNLTKSRTVFFVNENLNHQQKTANESFNLFKLLNDHVLGYYLKRYSKQKLLVLRKSRCWRGLRHEQHLPVRGQRSKTNANTRKKRLA